MSNIVRLNVNRGDLSILSLDHISLASVCAQQWCGREFEVESAGEVSASITEESDTAGLVGIEGLSPSIHAEYAY